MSKYRVTVNRRDVGQFETWVKTFEFASNYPVKEDDILVVTYRKLGALLTIVENNVMYLVPETIWATIKQQYRERLTRWMFDNKIVFTDDPVIAFEESGNPFIAIMALDAIQYQDRNVIRAIFDDIISSVSDKEIESAKARYFVSYYKRDIESIMEIFAIKDVLMDLMNFIFILEADGVLTLDEMSGIITTKVDFESLVREN